MSIGTDIDCFCPGFNRFLGEEARPAKSRQAVRAGLGDELPVAEVGGGEAEFAPDFGVRAYSTPSADSKLKTSP